MYKKAVVGTADLQVYERLNLSVDVDSGCGEQRISV
jgi:hypothetical protein